MKESSMDRSITEAANDQFDKVVRPYLRTQFNRMGQNYNERLTNVEAAIRRTILEHIKVELQNELKNAKDKKLVAEQKPILEKIAFIDHHLADKHQSLCKGDFKLMDEARRFFSSNELTSQIAWRCYDRRSKTYAWENLFVPHRNANRMVVGNIDLEAEDNEIPIGVACDIVRERAAYYYLAALDKTYPEIQQDSMNCFIHYLAEIRRAHNPEIPKAKNPHNYDDPSCFPGHITRLAQMADNHPKLRLTLRKGKRKLVAERVNNLIVEHFRKAVQGKSKEEVLALFNAITMMNQFNAEDLQRAPKASVYQGNWCGLREQFINDMTESSVDTIIPGINQYLLENHQQVLSEDEYIYVEFALLNACGEGLNDRLYRICETVGAVAKIKTDAESKDGLESQQATAQSTLQSALDNNPFAIRTLFPKEMDKTAKDVVIMKDKEKHNTYATLLPIIYKNIINLVQDKGEQLEVATSCTQALILQIFATDPTLEPKKRVLIALQELKGSAEHGHLVPDNSAIDAFANTLTAGFLSALQRAHQVLSTIPESRAATASVEVKTQNDTQKVKGKMESKHRSDCSGLSLDTTYSPRYNSLRAGLNTPGSNSGSTPGSKEKGGNQPNQARQKNDHFTFKIGGGNGYGSPTGSPKSKT